VQRWMVPLIAGGLLLWLGGQGWSQTPSTGIDRLLPQDCHGDAAVLDVTATRMTFDQQTHTFTFEDDVNIHRCSMTILCDRLQVISNAKTEEVERIIATGNVRVQQGARHIVAERAVFFAAEQRLVLTGHPRAWDVQEQREIEGEEMVILVSQEQVTVKRARVLFHPRKTPTNAP
jgi:lipopolysaccharide transport protein LptA